MPPTSAAESFGHRLLYGFRRAVAERTAAEDRLQQYLLPAPPEDPALFSFVMRQQPTTATSLKFLPFVP